MYRCVLMALCVCVFVFSPRPLAQFISQVEAFLSTWGKWRSWREWPRTSLKTWTHTRLSSPPLPQVHTFIFRRTRTLISHSATRTAVTSIVCMLRESFSTFPSHTVNPCTLCLWINDECQCSLSFCPYAQDFCKGILCSSDILNFFDW